MASLTDYFNTTGFPSFNDFNDTTISTESPTTRVTPDPYPGRHWLFNVRYFTRTYTYLSYSIGIPGNILTMIILARQKPSNSSAVWLGMMALIDLISLVVRCIVTPLAAYRQIQFSDALCVFYYMFCQATESINAMFLLAMTAERMIAVWFPLKMASWCSAKKAVIASVIITLVSFLLEFHLIETMQLTRWGSCYIKPQYYEFWSNRYVEIIQPVLQKFIPVFGVMILNILIIVKLRSSKKIQQKMSDEQTQEKMKQQRQIDRLLTVATLFFFVSLMPDVVQRLTEKYWGSRRDWEVSKAINICVNAFAALRVGNHAGNFYLYIIAAKRFRNDFIHLITGGRYGEHNGVKGWMLVKK